MCISLVTGPTKIGHKFRKKWSYKKTSVTKVCLLSFSERFRWFLEFSIGPEIQTKIPKKYFWCPKIHSFICSQNTKTSI